MNWNQQTENYQMKLMKIAFDTPEDQPMQYEEAISIEYANYISFYKKDKDSLFMWLADFSAKDGQQEAVLFWNILQIKDYDNRTNSSS